MAKESVKFDLFIEQVRKGRRFVLVSRKGCARVTTICFGETMLHHGGVLELICVKH